MEAPLPWEHELWSGRPIRPVRWLRGERYILTDFRLVRRTRRRVDELVLHDIADVRRTESRLDRLLGTSTIAARPLRRDLSPIVLSGIRRGASLAALLELLSGDPKIRPDAQFVQAALAWNPQPVTPYLPALTTLVAMLAAIFIVVAIGVRGRAATVSFAPDEAIEPNGVKKERAEIVRFMETEVMPWARVALAPIKGGADRVSCDTCHGQNAAARDWAMPSVVALPLPDVRERGWETYTSVMDAQMRNAIYGYVAEPDNQAKAAYMREIVVPGMARVLHRPAYDFTRTYDYNRSRHALGCYHCHRVK